MGPPGALEKFEANKYWPYLLMKFIISYFFIGVKNVFFWGGGEGGLENFLFSERVKNTL